MKRLFWYQWGETSSLSCLNIIDYRNKTELSETIPWFNVPYTEGEIHKYSQLTVYKAYKEHILNKIASTDNIFVSVLIQNMLYVCNLYNIVLDSDRKSFLYRDVVHLLYEKRFDDPTTFRNLWNSLCGNSIETKINVLSTIFERRDEKSAIMLSYILKIAQEAQFNFWGVWFKKKEENYLYFCPVTLALLKGNEDHLILLLQYGFEQNPDRVGIYDKYYYHLHRNIYSWLRQPLEERNPGRSAIVTEILLLLVQISKLESKNKLKSIEKCFRLLWSVNAIPFVTKSEVVNEIYRRYQSPPTRPLLPSFPYTCKHFIKLVLYYDLVKPQESTDEMHPRSLQQLCKYVIRKTLVKSYNLPHGIEKLPLPTKLQSFLHV